jgi:methylmalonyl-CoA mutase
LTEIPFAADFPPASRDEWLALVEKALKGAPFETLRSKTYDGLIFEPAYERAA